MWHLLYHVSEDGMRDSQLNPFQQHLASIWVGASERWTLCKCAGDKWNRHIWSLYVPKGDFVCTTDGFGRLQKTEEDRVRSRHLRKADRNSDVLLLLRAQRCDEVQLSFHTEHPPGKREQLIFLSDEIFRGWFWKAQTSSCYLHHLWLKKHTRLWLLKPWKPLFPHIPVLLTERKAGPGQTVTFYPAEAVMWTGLGLEQSTKLVTSICVESPDGKS